MFLTKSPFFCLVHRIGRTGRSGNTGIATTFINKSCGKYICLWSFDFTWLLFVWLWWFRIHNNKFIISSHRWICFDGPEGSASGGQAACTPCTASAQQQWWNYAGYFRWAIPNIITNFLWALYSHVCHCFKHFHMWTAYIPLTLNI